MGTVHARLRPSSPATFGRPSAPAFYRNRSELSTLACQVSRNLGAASARRCTCEPVPVGRTRSQPAGVSPKCGSALEGPGAVAGPASTTIAVAHTLLRASSWAVFHLSPGKVVRPLDHFAH